MRDKTIRCDNCGSEAWVSVKLTTVIPVENGTAVPSVATLDFCGHHYSKNSLLLHAQGWIITNDEREALQVNYVHPVPVNG